MKTEQGPLVLADLLASIKTTGRFDYANVPIESVTDDSRRVAEKTLFIAVRGENVDGHEFIADAVQRGAAAVVCERAPAPLPSCPVLTVQNSRAAMSALASAFHGHPARDLFMVGVTGSDGKTTTTELIRTILQSAGFRAGSLGTVSYKLGQRVIESDQTTPHPLHLHAMLREMADAGATHAAMEVSSHALVHRRTDDVPFKVAVLTNVTEDHLDFHRSRKAYVRAKQRLFESLTEECVAVLNADDRVWKRYRKATRGNVMTYGMRHLADVRLDRMKADINGMKLAVHTPLGTYEIETSLVGTFNCENILAAATAAFAMGVPSAAVRRALRTFTGVPGRMERVTPPSRPDLPLVFVDYAHTGEALRRALSTLRPLTQGKLICVFGCGGNREKEKRPVMGHAATSIADLSIITSDNSRNENTEDIIADILAGIRTQGARFDAEPDRRRAIQRAIAEATSPGDVVAICGRGCEQVQIIGEQRLPFDDRMVACEALDEIVLTRRKSA